MLTVDSGLFRAPAAPHPAQVRCAATSVQGSQCTTRGQCICDVFCSVDPNLSTLSSTQASDFLLIRTPLGTLHVRGIRGTLLIGQQEPCLRVPFPGSKEYKDLEERRFHTWVYRELRACDVKLSKKGEAGQPYIESKTLTKAFPFTAQSMLKMRMQACQCKQEGNRWVLKEDVRIPTEQELRKEVPMFTDWSILGGGR